MSWRPRKLGAAVLARFELLASPPPDVVTAKVRMRGKRRLTPAGRRVRVGRPDSGNSENLQTLFDPSKGKVIAIKAFMQSLRARPRRKAGMNRTAIAGTKNVGTMTQRDDLGKSSFEELFRGKKGESLCYTAGCGMRPRSGTECKTENRKAVAKREPLKRTIFSNSVLKDRIVQSQSRVPTLYTKEEIRPMLQTQRLDCGESPKRSVRDDESDEDDDDFVRVPKFNADDYV